MWVAIGAAFREPAYSGARVVVLTGAGVEFGAGAELTPAPDSQKNESSAAAPFGTMVDAMRVLSDVVLAVHNGGTPIPREALPTIFEPLVRGARREGQPPRRAGSIGLGLYIAREIVIAHAGTIDVNSSAESGTTFTVRLPRDKTVRCGFD